MSSASKITLCEISVLVQIAVHLFEIFFFRKIRADFPLTVRGLKRKQNLLLTWTDVNFRRNQLIGFQCEFVPLCVLQMIKTCNRRKKWNVTMNIAI